MFFDYDRFQIRMDAMSVLDANAGWLRANGDTTVLIEGHCDERGTVAYNLVLGEKRARATKKYLQDLGIRLRSCRSRAMEKRSPSASNRTKTVINGIGGHIS